MLQFVDDSHLVGDPEEAAAFEALFFKRWGARFETCDFYLNMNVRTDGDGRFNLSQPAYAQDLLEKYGMVNARGASTPLVPGTNVDKEQRAVPASIIRVGTDSDQLVSKSGVPDSVKKPQQKGKMPKPKATAQSKAQMETMTFSNDAKSIKSELHHGIWTRIDPSDSWDTLMGPNKVKYQEVLGAISYYANTTRPDLAQAASMMGQVSCAPRMRHWRHLQHMLRYVKKHPHRGIRFSKQDNAESNILVCYVDSSFGDGPSGRATTGYTFFMNGGCVSWRSNLQKSTSRSTMEAEVSAAAYAAEEAKFLNDLLYEMGDPMRKPIAFIHKQPMVFHEDNAACIVFCNNINVTGRNKKMGRPCNFDTAPLHKWIKCSKCKLQASGVCESAHDPTHCIDIPSAQRHIRQNYFEIRQLIADGEAIMIKCDTANMVADALTKALGPISFVNTWKYSPPICRQSLATNVVAPCRPIRGCSRICPTCMSSSMVLAQQEEVNL